MKFLHKKQFLIGVLIAFMSNFGQAQIMLQLPESNLSANLDMPTHLCLLHSARLIKSVSVEDTASSKLLHSIGQQLMRLGKHEFAKDAFDKLLEMNSKAYPKSDPRYIQSAIDLARVYMFLIRYEETENMYEEVLDLIVRHLGEDSPLYLMVLVEAAEPSFLIREIKKSMEYSLKAKVYLESKGKTNSLAYAIVLNNLAAAKSNNNETANAILLYEQSMKILQKEKNRFYILTVAANLAEAYAHSGEIEKGMALLAKYAPIAPKSLQAKNTLSARVFMQIGIAYTQLKEFEKADNAFKTAFVFNSLDITSVEDIANQAEDLFFKNEFLATCAQAGTMMNVIQMFRAEYEHTGNMQALEKGFQVLGAMNKFKQSLDNKFSSDKNRLILFNLGASLVMETGIFFSYELWKKTKDPVYVQQAFSLSELTKSTLLLHTLQSKSNKHFGHLPDSLLAKEKQLRQGVKDLQRRILESTVLQEQEQLRAELSALYRKVDQFKELLRQKCPDYYKHNFENKPLDIAAVQASLDSKTALLEYYIGYRNTYVFCLTADKIEMQMLAINPNELALQSEKLRKVLSDFIYIKTRPEQAQEDLIKSSSYFYQQFVQPILASKKGIDRLVVIPDKILGHLPFEVFLTAKPTNLEDYASYPYLIEQYSISYAYSASLLLEKAKHGRKPKNPGVLAYAGDYDGGPIAENRGSNLRAMRQALQPLPGAIQEVSQMKQYLYGAFYLGKDANERSFKENAENFNIIHLATHGLLNSENPILSSIAFSEDGNSEEDNFLHAYEISQMELSASLVVLSACETGYGTFQQGEGVMSLAHSFVYAGAQSVLVSLWQVNDYSTGEIMKYFYLNIGQGMSKDKALREAKLQFMQKHKGEVNHPAFWAAFVQLGDSSPVELLCKVGLSWRNKPYFMGGGVLFLLLVGGWLLLRHRFKMAS